MLRTLAVSMWLTARYAEAAAEAGGADEAAVLRHELVALLNGWLARGGALDREMAGLLEQMQHMPP